MHYIVDSCTSTFVQCLLYINIVSLNLHQPMYNYPSQSTNLYITCSKQTTSGLVGGIGDS